MDTRELISHTDSFIERISEDNVTGIYAEICQFLTQYSGAKSSFLTSVISYDPRKVADHYASDNIKKILKSFKAYLEAGLHVGVSPERKAQIDVVSDFLEMAQTLLDTKGVHPAAPTVLIGATLEEFLRTWMEKEDLTLSGKKRSLQNYAEVLRAADLVNKQDVKDITSWGGLRNHAAHGEWEEVADKQRIGVMLEGVNLFMRKYESH